MKLNHLTLIASSLAVLACGSKGNDSNLTKDPNTNGEIHSSCIYSYSQGPQASMNLAYNDQTVSVDFGKKFNVNYLNAVLNASAESTVRFAELTGVKFYRTEQIESAACSFTSELPIAPSDLYNKFETMGDNVLGLYLPQKTKGIYSLDSHSGIIVRKDSDRWTLVHEFMHHAFDSKARVNKSSDRVKEEISEISSQLSYYDSKLKLTTEEHAKLLSLTSDLLLNFKEIILRYSAEEVTIETLLGDKYDKNLFTHVDFNQRINGAYYISSSAKKAIEMINSITPAIHNMFSSVDLKLSSEDRYKNQHLEKNINNKLSDLSDLRSSLSIYKYNADLWIASVKRQRIKKGLSGILPVSEVQPCSHQKEIDQVVETILSSIPK
jgi:hypothetical protein